MKIFNVGNKDVNIYLLDSGSKRLLIDTGFPNSLNEIGRHMRETGYKIKDIDYLIITHFHIDHAGAVQELKDNGVQFILADIQINFINQMELMTAGKWKYKNLNKQDNILINIDESREFLEKARIDGQILSTPGHTDDSISLVLDSGEAFTGDLMPEYLLMDSDLISKRSWKTLKEHKARIIYPGHGKEYEIKQNN